MQLLLLLLLDCPLLLVLHRRLLRRTSTVDWERPWTLSPSPMLYEPLYSQTFSLTHLVLLLLRFFLRRRRRGGPLRLRLGGGRGLRRDDLGLRLGQLFREWLQETGKDFKKPARIFKKPGDFIKAGINNSGQKYHT